jgi:antitoxin ParD1/3/4
MNASVSLKPEFVDLIKAKVESGRYASADDVVRKALQLLERAEQLETDQLREAWREGVESGDAGSLDFDALRKTARAELAQIRKS